MSDIWIASCSCVDQHSHIEYKCLKDTLILRRKDKKLMIRRDQDKIIWVSPDSQPEPRNCFLKTHPFNNFTFLNCSVSEGSLIWHHSEAWHLLAHRVMTNNFRKGKKLTRTLCKPTGSPQAWEGVTLRIFPSPDAPLYFILERGLMKIENIGVGVKVLYLNTRTQAYVVLSAYIFTCVEALLLWLSERQKLFTILILHLRHQIVHFWGE